MKTGSVLLVFDELVDLQNYGSLLCSLGYRILLCNSMSEGVRALETEDVSFVLLSQGTAAFEGREVLQRAHQLHPDAPVLVIAKVLDMRCYLEAMELGAADYLERPDPSDLAWAIDTQTLRSGAA